MNHIPYFLDNKIKLLATCWLPSVCVIAKKLSNFYEVRVCASEILLCNFLWLFRYKRNRNILKKNQHIRDSEYYRADIIAMHMYIFHLSKFYV